MANPVYIAQANGFSAGALFTCKSTKVVFKLDGFTDIGAVFTEQVLFGKPLKQTATFEALQKSFVPHKGNMQVQMPSDTAFFAGQHASLNIDLKKCLAYQALMLAAKRHCEKEESVIQYYLHPSEIRCKNACNTKELKLVPVTDFANLMSKPRGTASKYSMVHKEHGQFWIETPILAKSEKKEDWNKNSILASFWWVKTTENQADANMTMAKMNVEGFAFPIFENSKALNVHDKLVVYAEPRAAKKART